MHPAVILVTALLGALIFLSFARRKSIAGARQGLTLGLLVLGVIIVVALGVRYHWGIGLLAALPLLFRVWRQIQAMSGRYSPSAGQTSTVETQYIRMVIDHDSGEMTGTVLKGDYAGAAIETLDLEALLTVLASCRVGDAQGARVLETFIEHKFPGEFEAHEDGEGHSQDRDSGAPLSRRQALDVLGLEEGASEDEIVEAHRRLMQKLHPDRGGSSFLAAQINRAKDTLLRR